MSHCELIIFKNGKQNHSVEFGNSWGGSPRIWSVLFDYHIPKIDQFDSWLLSDHNDRRLWDLVYRKDIPEFERSVLAFTFDRFYVKRSNFKRLSSDLVQFVKKHPVVGKVDHLLSWAKCIEENDKSEDVEAIGLYGTSVSENLWERYKECQHCGNTTDEIEYVHLDEGTEIYDFLNCNTLEKET